MSSGAQVELDWAGTDAAQDGASAPGVRAPNAGGAGGAYLTDEEILGMEPVDASAPTHSTDILGGRAEDSRRGEAKNLSSLDRAGDDATKRDSSGKDGPQNDSQGTFAERIANSPMPEWMAAAAADPKHGGEAQQLWREHQEFRAAFSSSEEARAIKELLPGGVKDVLSLREATQSVDRIDAALFSGDARAQADVVAELARTNPAAFRSMFAEAARVLAGMGSRSNETGSRESGNSNGGFANGQNTGPTLRKDGEGWGTQTQNQDQSQNRIQNQNQDQSQNQIQNPNQDQSQNRRRDAGAATAVPVANQESQLTNHPSREASANQSPRFDAAAYSAFERATNDEVARDVRGSISETLGRVMPEGVAEGASRRMGEDIFNEVHRALAADRELSEQVASVLRDRRFGVAEQQRVAALLAGRAKQLVPSVARRVIGEWTSTVLNTARSKAARQAAAASRVDIAAAGGSLDSMPLRAMSAREVNYTSMSDEDILGM